MAQSKTQFAERAVNMAATLANLADTLEVLEKVYTARDYTFTTLDLEPLGITPGEFAQVLGVIQRFGLWVNGAAVTPTNNRELVNKYRTDL